MPTGGDRKDLGSIFIARAVNAPDAAQVVDLAISSWRTIDAALAPIVGKDGVAALCKRSLFLIRGPHPWLINAMQGEPTHNEFDLLRSVFAEQAAAEVIAANGVLLQTFHSLLARMIGESLTERLLMPDAGDTSSGDSAKDTVS